MTQCIPRACTRTPAGCLPQVTPQPAHLYQVGWQMQLTMRAKPIQGLCVCTCIHRRCIYVVAPHARPLARLHRAQVFELRGGLRLLSTLPTGYALPTSLAFHPRMPSLLLATYGAGNFALLDTGAGRLLNSYQVGWVGDRRTARPEECGHSGLLRAGVRPACLWPSTCRHRDPSRCCTHTRRAGALQLNELYGPCPRHKAPSYT